MASQNARIHGSTDNATYAPDALSRAQALMRGAYLADALTLWECYDDEPLQDAPLVLRFSTCDLIVATGTDAGPELTLGTVNTSETPASPPNKHYANGEVCLTWIPIDSLSAALGQQVTGIHSHQIGCTIDLEEHSIHLNADGKPTIDGARTETD